MVPTVVRVASRQEETPGVFTLGLELPASGWRFQPGQFNMLYAFGVGEAAISLCGDSSDSSQVLHTIRAVGSVTNALQRMQPGDSVGVRGPFGSCWPLEAARGNDLVIVAGGIGLPPLRSALYHLMRRRQDYGRVALLYGVRTPADVLYRDEIASWRQHDIQVLVTVDRGDPAWAGPIGVVTELFPHCQFRPRQTFCLLCGPEVMMRFSIREFLKLGGSEDHVYLSLERNMQCAVGFCGHCQFGPEFVCKRGPVFRYDQIKRFFSVPEV